MMAPTKSGGTSGAPAPFDPCSSGCDHFWPKALQRNQAFIDRYREARADQLAGQEATFPAGTWWLHRFAGVKCAELGATAPPS